MKNSSKQKIKADDSSGILNKFEVDLRGMSLLAKVLLGQGGKEVMSFLVLRSVPA